MNHVQAGSGHFDSLRGALEGSALMAATFLRVIKDGGSDAAEALANPEGPQWRIARVPSLVNPPPPSTHGLDSRV